MFTHCTVLLALHCLYILNSILVLEVNIFHSGENPTDRRENAPAIHLSMQFEPCEWCRSKNLKGHPALLVGDRMFVHQMSTELH